jgi:hypothetical protein
VKGGIEHERALEVGAGLLFAPLGQLRFAEPEERKRIVPRDCKRAHEARFGGRMIPALEQEVAEIRMGLCQRGIERECHFELRDRELGLAEASIGDRQVAAYRGIAEARIHRANERDERAPGIPELQSQHAYRVQRFGIFRQAREECLEARFGARAVAGLERFERPGDGLLVGLRLTGGLRGETPLLFTHRLASAPSPAKRHGFEAYGAESTSPSASSMARRIARASCWSA